MNQCSTAVVGGAFLVEEALPEQTLIPEELPAEARRMARTMEQFVRKKVLPRIDELEAQQDGLMRGVLQAAGTVGLLGTGVPERYGGLDLPRSVATLLYEKAAAYASFALSLGVHSGVATLPLLYFGTPEQKQRYLPKLASGEMIGAFALSEADAGSDALAARARATPDGAYFRLSGTKLWITNAGFADLFTVFARVDGTQFTAFLVERNTPGVTIGREERKMGLRGSSTCRLVLNDALVPAQNLLGEIGNGRRVALCPLNIGRHAIAAGALGACKEIVQTATRYATQRAQFGRPIAGFGLIQHKLAEMAVRTFVLESALYRTAHYLDAPDGSEERLAAAQEYAVECALVKILGTEVLGFVADEGLQIHGGFGYSEDYPLARAYRDARITRIFEGTNEINRLTVVDQLLRRVKQSRLALPRFIADTSTTVAATEGIDPGEVAGTLVRAVRQVVLHTFGQAWHALGDGLAGTQEIGGALADMVLALYALESAWLRVIKLRSLGHQQRFDTGLAVVQIYAADVCAQVEHRACTVLANLGIPTDVLQGGLSPPCFDTISLRRRIAVAVLDAESYPW